MSNVFVGDFKGVADEPSFTSWQHALIALGLNTPLRRFAGFTLLSGVLLYAIRPRPFFTADGSARPWSLLTLGKKSGAVESTVVPWYFVPLFIGFLGASFL